MSLLDHAYIVGLPLGFAIYVVLMRLWILPSHPQAEESGFSRVEAGSTTVTDRSDI